jgi:hypothetical protein
MDSKTGAKALSEEEKDKLRQMSQISLWLDKYNDIFSDFDPRPFSHRALSFDFLDEVERAVKEKKTGTVELNLLMPAKRRNPPQESTIKRRLKRHFEDNHNEKKNEIFSLVKHGAVLSALGILFMFLATYILFYHPQSSLFMSFLIILLEPAGWFTFWSGLDEIIFDTKARKRKLDFFRKMSKCDIKFMPY